MGKDWTRLRTEGQTSRQAHADFPPGTFEREMGKEGFGPSTQFHHAHPPTAWTSFDRPPAPAAAFDFDQAGARWRCPWKAKAILTNNTCVIAHWSTDKAMDHLVRNSEGDYLLPCTKAKAISSVISAALNMKKAIISSCPARLCGASTPKAAKQPC